MAGDPTGGSQPLPSSAGKASSIGQISNEPLTWTASDAVTVGAASGVLLAAAEGTGRVVRIKVPLSATTGICINYAAPATTAKQLIEPGETEYIPTEQEIRAIRAGAVDVTTHVSAGVVSA